MVIAHTPFEQLEPAFVWLHVLPQPPQLPRLVLMFVSQPFAGLPSQSANPAAQVPSWQAPPWQVADAFAKLHALPQPPQLPALVVVSVSQPSATVPLQLAKPVWHDTIPHVPPWQLVVAFARAQTFPHDPQLAMLVLRFTSQPVCGLLSQSA